MKHKILLNLIAFSTLAGSMLALVLAKQATATATIDPTDDPTQAVCSAFADPGIATDSGNVTDPGMLISAVPSESQIATRVDASTGTVVNEFPMMDFTEAESDAAVALFGCDCPPCINALRQLQSQSLSQVLLSSNQNNSQGHCWTTLQQRVSPHEAQEILQQLDADETNL